MVYMVEFHIIENPDPAYFEKYDEFVKLYNDKNITVDDIRRKLGWRTKVYNDARRKALDEGKIVDRRSKKSIDNCKGRPLKKKLQPKYYYYDKKTRKFIVKKNYYINKKEVVVYYGSFKDCDVAKQVVLELKKVNWDKSKLNDIKQKLGLI